MASDDTDERQVDDGSGDRYRDDSNDPVEDADLETAGDDGFESTDRDVGDGEGEDDVRTTAIEEVDQRIVDLLSWILDTETRAKIYVYLLANPGSTSEEVAQGTGLYPSTVREALAELHEEDRVTREKRASEGAGNNPYEYTAIQPSELVGGVVDQVQQELNTIFELDRILDRRDADPDLEDGDEPVTITVNDTEPPEPATAAGDDADPTADETADDTTESRSPSTSESTSDSEQ